MTENRRYDLDRETAIKRRHEREKRREAAKKRRRRKYYIRVAIRLAIIVLVLAGIITGIVFGIKGIVSLIKNSDKNSAESQTEIQETIEDTAPSVDSSMISVTDEPVEEETEPITEPERVIKTYSASANEYTTGFPENVASEFGIFIDVETGNILAQVEPQTRMFPASMTKVLTCLVAAEHVTNLDDTFVLTPEINYYAYKNDCSTVGFSDEEEVTIRDLFYGTMLPSGGEAAVALATYVAGSHEEFVNMMNEKVAELGLSETTHFTNCVGLFADDHYTTAYDMAMIMEAAMDNELCREVMHAHIYTTSSTPQHPNGLEISNWFLRKIEDHITNGEVYCAKTGFVNESGNCAASFGIDSIGREYICVTGNSTGNWKCIKDHVAIYNTVFNPAG